MTDVIVPSSELQRRTIRRGTGLPNAAFIDCRTPGSDRKSNYAFMGPASPRTPGSSSTSASGTATTSVPPVCPETG